MNENNNKFIQNKLVVSTSPHVKSGTTTSGIMMDVVIALMFPLIASILIFGAKSLIVTVTSVVFCVLFEYLFNVLCHKEQHIKDLSAVVTGMLLAFNLPVSIPIPIVIIGAFIAIVIVKMLFGGIGQNFANPAITARIILFISFAGPMSAYAVDAIAGPTPLYIMSNNTGDTLPTLLNMFLGVKGGVLGETSILAILIGGIYLIITKVISPMIPVTFIGTVFILSFILGNDPLYQILSGGLFLGAFFMATDYTTSPTSMLGKFIMGIGCGVLTVVIRQYSAYPEGVSFAILLMNILTPHIDTLTKKKVFGVIKNKIKKG